MTTILQDVRHGIRLLVRDGAFTSVALVTLAIGIGANTAIFSVVDAVVLSPLPYASPERLVRVREERAEMRGEGGPAIITSDTLLAWRGASETLEGIAGYSQRSFTLTGRGDPVRLRGAAVSPDMFPMLGATPALGRLFESQEERPGANRVVVLSHTLWQQQFGGDRAIVGGTLLLDDEPHEVVGVMARTFSFPDRDTTLWTPLTLTVPNLRPGQVMIMAFAGIARLEPGTPIDRAAAEGQTIVQRIHSERGGPMADRPAPTLRLVPLQEEVIGEARSALLLMMAAVGFVLLIACANVANLLLARGATRQREMAIRAAVGAGRGRLLRHLLIENLVLSLAAGAVGVLAALWMIRALPALGPGDIPRLDAVGLNPSIVGFALALSIGTGLLFGLLPALESSRLDLNAALRDEGATGGRGFRLLGANRGRSLLAIGEIALALVLLVGAGLLAKSFMRLAQVDPGYDPDRVLTTRLALPPNRYTEPRRLAMLDALLARLAETPGVEAAGLVTFLPLTSGEQRVILRVDGGAPPGDPSSPPAARPQVVSAGYFQAMGMRLVQGRWLTPVEDANGSPVVLVNETFARQYVPNEDPIGRQLDLGEGTQEIVGVVADVRHAGLDAEPAAEFYGSYRGQFGRFAARGVNLAVRTVGDPLAFVPELRRAVLDLDPALPLDDVMTMDARLSGSVARPRFYALLLGLFATLALVLAAVGVYGILAYTVSQRRREIGIRMAVGARQASILALVLRQGATLTALGLVFGVLAALATTRLLRGLLFGVTPNDMTTFVVAPLVLGAIGLLACYLPARRAARVDPVLALRGE